MMRRLAAAFLSMSLLATAATATPDAGKPTAIEDMPAEVHPGYMPRMPQPTRAEVLKALAARRARNLAAFHAYRKAGVYPHNFVRTGPLNVWRDREGHLCAAATIINADGQAQLVENTAAMDNNIRLLDVTDGPMLDWLMTSGFTLEEIDQIQFPGFRPAPRVIETEPKGWSLTEDKRLRRHYVATEAWLVRHRKAGLATAADRLMERPDLARALLDSMLSS